MQAGALTDGAVDVADGTARAAQNVVVVVPDAVLVQGGGADRLDASHDAALDEGIQGVIYRLLGDRTDVRTGEAGNVIGGAVRRSGNRAQNGETLRSDDDSVGTQCVGLG